MFTPEAEAKLLKLTQFSDLDWNWLLSGFTLRDCNRGEVLDMEDNGRWMTPKVLYNKGSFIPCQCILCAIAPRRKIGWSVIIVNIYKVEDLIHNINDNYNWEHLGKHEVTLLDPRIEITKGILRKKIDSQFPWV